MKGWCERLADVPPERPCIVLLLAAGVDERVAEAIGTGCEEEGIPAAWTRALSPEDTAHAASLRSRLDVGVLVMDAKAAVGVAQIPDRAWLDVGAAGPADWRWVGQAAARIVKGQPMPPRPGEVPDYDPEPDPVMPPDAPSPLPEPEVGLLPMRAPYAEERERAVDALVARVTQEVMRRLQELGDGTGMAESDSGGGTRGER